MCGGGLGGSAVGSAVGNALIPDGKTQYFTLHDADDEEGSVHCLAGLDGCDAWLGLEKLDAGADAIAPKSGAEAWAREQRVLEESKARFERTVQRELEVEESVSLLLEKLKQLPNTGVGNRETAAKPPEPIAAADEAQEKPPAAQDTKEHTAEPVAGSADAAEAGQVTQKQAALQRLQRVGVNVHPLGPECLEEAKDEAGPGAGEQGSQPPAPALSPAQEDGLTGHSPPPMLGAPASAGGLSSLLSSPLASPSRDAQTPGRAWIPGASWAPEVPRTSPSHGLAGIHESPVGEWPQMRESPAGAWPQASADGWPAKREPPPPEWPQARAASAPRRVPEQCPEPPDCGSPWSANSSPTHKRCPQPAVPRLDSLSSLQSPSHGNSSPVMRLESILSPSDYGKRRGNAFPDLHRGQELSSPRLAAAAAKLRGSSPWSTRSGAASARSVSPGLSARGEFCTPPQTPRGGLGGLSPADTSLLPCRGAASLGPEDPWRGWSVETSADGSLFYHHAESGTSQWEQPRELTSGLGEWRQLHDEQGNAFWRNELLNISSWNDPRSISNIFQAAESGELFFFQLYAYANGPFDAVDGESCTALHYTSASGHTELVSFLLQHGATVNVADNQGAAPLHYACRNGHSEIVRMLLEAGSHPDAQDVAGNTAMHEAAAVGRTDVLHWLCVARASPMVHNSESLIASQVAARAGARDAAVMLRLHAAAFAGQPHWEQDGGLMPHGRRPRGYPEPVQPETAWSEAGDAMAWRASRQGHQRGGRGGAAWRGSSPRSGRSSTDELASPSRALAVVRAARPLLRGVQWLAGRMLGPHDASERFEDWEEEVSSGYPTPRMARQPSGVHFEDDLDACFATPRARSRCASGYGTPRGTSAGTRSVSPSAAASPRRSVSPRVTLRGAGGGVPIPAGPSLFERGAHALEVLSPKSPGARLRAWTPTGRSKASPVAGSSDADFATP